MKMVVVMTIDETLSCLQLADESVGIDRESLTNVIAVAERLLLLTNMM